MFAQESVMDINKEREAFEKHASKFFKTNEAFEDDGENYVYDEVKFMWDCWLAAKAQAVPEGFVLVDKHQLAQLMANMDSFGKKALGDDYVSFADIAAVLDEAQEPTND